jgi:hypothetical protein
MEAGQGLLLAYAVITGAGGVVGYVKVHLQLSARMEHGPERVRVHDHRRTPFLP